MSTVLSATEFARTMKCNHCSTYPEYIGGTEEEVNRSVVLDGWVAAKKMELHNGLEESNTFKVDSDVPVFKAHYHLCRECALECNMRDGIVPNMGDLLIANDNELFILELYIDDGDNEMHSRWVPVNTIINAVLFGIEPNMDCVKTKRAIWRMA